MGDDPVDDPVDDPEDDSEGDSEGDAVGDAVGDPVEGALDDRAGSVSAHDSQASPKSPCSATVVAPRRVHRTATVGRPNRGMPGAARQPAFLKASARRRRASAAVIGGANTQAVADAPVPAVHRHPNSFATSVSPVASAARWPLRHRSERVGSPPTAPLTASGATRAQKLARPTVSSVVRTCASGVGAGVDGVVGPADGSSEPPPEQPAAARTSTAAGTARRRARTPRLSDRPSDGLNGRLSGRRSARRGRDMSPT